MAAKRRLGTAGMVALLTWVVARLPVVLLPVVEEPVVEVVEEPVVEPVVRGAGEALVVMLLSLPNLVARSKRVAERASSLTGVVRTW